MEEGLERMVGKGGAALAVNWIHSSLKTSHTQEFAAVDSAQNLVREEPCWTPIFLNLSEISMTSAS